MGAGVMAISSLAIGRMPFSSADRLPALNCRADASGASGTKLVAQTPVYIPTAPNRATRSPHSGYHFDGSSRRFFEGWYFKVSIPEVQESFAWMYSVEDPGWPSGLGGLESLLGGPKFPGVGTQIMGANDEYIFQFDSDVKTFWGSRHELSLGHTFKPGTGKLPPTSEVPPTEFWQRVEQGFQVTPTWHQGFVVDNGRSEYAETVETVRWEYSTEPIYGWGDIGYEQKATAGWLAAFPFFEPHWQVCMAGGLSTGWIEWGDRRFEFENAPSYSEKNWGGSFPQKWFWVQCNVFEGVSGEVALTAGGGRRGLPLLAGSSEEVAMVGVHYGGKFYEFVPWTGSVEWEVAPWGSWKMSASNQYYKVKLEATTDGPGVTLRAPTSDAGLAPFCRDSFEGKLRLQLWAISVSGPDSLILDTTSTMAALETGGAPWYTTWKQTSQVQDPLRTIVGLPVNVEEVLQKAPQLKPPGL
ncbi:unnamed protein product [Calypogeia fissa]